MNEIIASLIIACSNLPYGTPWTQNEREHKIECIKKISFCVTHSDVNYARDVLNKCVLELK